MCDQCCCVLARQHHPLVVEGERVAPLVRLAVGHGTVLNQLLNHCLLQGHHLRGAKLVHPKQRHTRQQQTRPAGQGTHPGGQAEGVVMVGASTENQLRLAPVAAKNMPWQLIKHLTHPAPDSEVPAATSPRLHAPNPTPT